MRIFFSVGEPSGDLHGANLIHDLRSLHPGIQCVGYGGPKMASAGCLLHEDLTKLAVMFFLQVFLNLQKFWLLMRRADRYFRDNRVDAVVLIDYPGFNWWIARRAKAHNIPVFYYGAPQMWAWAGWRVKKMRRLVDHVLCKLPFEEKWYRERNCNAKFIGHPYFDEMLRQRIDQSFLDQQQAIEGPLVTILPGSRNQEVTDNLASFLKAAQLIHQRVPAARFAIASFNQRQAEVARREASQVDLPVEVFQGRTAELIRLADCCIACSGSVSLELLYHEKPTVIHYHINKLIWHGRKVFMRVKYITLVNLLYTDQIEATSSAAYDPDAPDAEDVPFPEYLTNTDKSDRIAPHIVRWLRDPAARQHRVSQLHQLKEKYCRPGASREAASYILTALGFEVGQARRSPLAA